MMTRRRGRFGHCRECLVGIDAREAGAGDIGDCRARPGGRENRVSPDLLVVDEDPVTLQPGLGAVDNLDSRPAGLGFEDRGEFLLESRSSSV